MLAGDLSPPDPAFEEAKVNEWNEKCNASLFFFRYCKCWAMFPAAAALMVCGSSVIAQGGPINECFGKVLDHVGATQNPGNVLLLRSQVFPVAGHGSVQSLSDDRIPDRVVRQWIAQLTPIYQSCVNESYADNVEVLDDLNKSHMAARVSLLQRLADGAMTYAEYAKQLNVLRGQLNAGLFFWQMDT